MKKSLECTGNCLKYVFHGDNYSLVLRRYPESFWMNVRVSQSRFGLTANLELSRDLFSKWVQGLHRVNNADLREEAKVECDALNILIRNDFLPAGPEYEVIFETNVGDLFWVKFCKNDFQELIYASESLLCYKDVGDLCDGFAYEESPANGALRRIEIQLKSGLWARFEKLEKDAIVWFRLLNGPVQTSASIMLEGNFSELIKALGKEEITWNIPTVGHYGLSAHWGHGRRVNLKLYDDHDYIPFWICLTQDEAELIRKFLIMVEDGEPFFSCGQGR